MRAQDEAEVRRLLQQQENRIGRLFQIAIDEFLNDVSVGQLVDLLERGRIAEALEGVTQIAIATANASQGAFLAAATATSEYIQSTNRFTLGFDQTNPRAIALLNRNKLEFIQGFTDTQRRATLTALQTGLSEGVGPRTVARRFRASIGLTEGQQRAVDNYRRLLGRVGADDVSRGLQREYKSRKLRDRRHDRRIERAVREGKPLTAAEIDRMVERYRKNSIAHRALNIARTESLSNVHSGQDASLDDAIRNGSVAKDEILQTWITARDGRQRDAHDDLHGTSVPWGDPWVNELGPILYPGDRTAVPANFINCRCQRTIRIR